MCFILPPLAIQFDKTPDHDTVLRDIAQTEGYRVNRSWKLLKHIIPVLVTPVICLILGSCKTPEQTADSSSVQMAQVFQSAILITIDTLRGDHPGFCGNPDVRSPSLDRMSQKSLLYPDAFTNLPLTLPAHAAMMTSRYPRELGLEINSARLDTGFTTLAEMFKSHGFATAGYPQAVLQFPRGFEQGFDTYYSPTYDRASQRVKAGDPVRRNRIILTEQKTDAPSVDQQIETIGIALDWLNDTIKNGRRYFLWMHFFEPHHPYKPAVPFRYIDQPGDRVSVQTAIANSWMLTEQAQLLTEADHQVNRCLYRDEIYWTDSKIDTLFRFITASGDRKPILIVTADHGESLYDRRPYYGHGNEVISEELHIPFFVYSGGTPAGIVDNLLVQSVDVAPTILSATGLPMLPDSRGMDVRQIHRDRQRVAPFSVGPLPKSIGAIDASYKVVHTIASDSWLFWDRQRDPDERIGHPVDETAPEHVRHLRAIADDYQALHSRVEAADNTPTDDDAEFRKMLESLGYLQ